MHNIFQSLISLPHSLKFKSSDEYNFWNDSFCYLQNCWFKRTFFFAGSDTAAKYYGGEIRQEGGGRQAVVVLAAETTGLASPREAVASRLLQKILGKFHYCLCFI